MPAKPKLPKNKVSTQTANARMRAENAILRAIVVDLHWMARRYADGRSTYAPGLLNDHTRTLVDMGIKLNQTGDNTIWAKDGMGRAYDGLTDEEFMDRATVAVRISRNDDEMRLVSGRRIHTKRSKRKSPKKH